MRESLSRRNFVHGVAGAAALTASAHAADAPAQAPDRGREVRLEHLRPHDIDKAMQACPTLFLPLGTVEWHGLHNITGLDAVKAHMLCVRAAQRGGGLVAPPLFGGLGGLAEPHTFVIEPEDDLFSVLLRPWLERLCREAVRQGFRAVIMLTGHYGAAQQICVRETAVRMSRVLGAPVLGTPEYFLALDAGYTGDHAAWGETSLMMHLYPESVDLTRLGEEPHRGVGGRDPKTFASAADGARLAETIVGRLAALAPRMPAWDSAARARFAAAESALVERQIALAAAEKKIWAAWRNVPAGAFADYGALLVEGRFEEIAVRTATL
jgi:creatinine amidohydrolase